MIIYPAANSSMATPWDKSRTLSTSLPADVAVGSIDIGPERLLYTFVNSSTLAGGLAAVGGSVFLLIIFLYF